MYGHAFFSPCCGVLLGSTLEAAQSIQPSAQGSTLIRTSPSTRVGLLSCNRTDGSVLRRVWVPSAGPTARGGLLLSCKTLWED